MLIFVIVKVALNELWIVIFGLALLAVCYVSLGAI